MAEKTYNSTFVAEQIKQIIVLVQLVPDEALEDTIKFIDDQEAIGPLLDPTAFQGNKFRELSNRKKRCQAIMELKKILKETNDGDPK